MLARNTILAAAVLFGLGGLAPALAQHNGTPPAQGATPAPAIPPASPPSPPASTPSSSTGGSTHGNAMAGSQGIEFQTEADAKTHCPADKIVWANLTSKAYHLSGDRFYGSGKTKKGAYMCQTDADANGFHKAGARHAATAAKKPS